ncbi:MAG TPA: MFS transporter [Rubrobacteraceae bacterium]|nr:MFS transporter [Rubrobacteraceae bacterium]
MDAANHSLLRNVRFRRLWIGQGLSFVGDAASMVALVVLVVQIAGSASAVGGALVARLLPTLASPVAGVFADRLDRRAVLITTDVARAALTVGLIFAESLLIVYALVFLIGLCRTFFNPTIRAAFPGVVGGGDLTRANGLFSATFSVSITAGPALGGALVAALGVDAAFLLDSVTYLVSAAFLSRISLPRPEREDAVGVGRDLRDGLSYLAGARVPLAIVVGAFLAILTINTTIPAEVFLAKDVFDAGNVGYGLLVSLWGGGTVLGAVLMILLGDRINLLFLYFLSIFGGALALVGTGLSPVFALALGALMLEGTFTGIENVATDTILQKRVPDTYLGRVFAIRFLSYSAGEAIAYVAGGLIVDAVGPRSTYLLAGISTVAVGFVVLLLISLPTRGGR